MVEKQEVEYNHRASSCSIDEFDIKNDKPVQKSPEEIAFIKKLNWKVLPMVFLVIFIQVCQFVFNVYHRRT